jgi:phenol/toluene 2-monooxygenase (NADH) P0/A0
MDRDTSLATAAGEALTQPAAGEAPHRKFVRVIERHANGVVKFEFAVGWPDLSCELALPAPMFDEFCLKNRVEFLGDAPAPDFPLQGQDTP